VIARVREALQERVGVEAHRSVSTYSELQSRIADDINRTDLTSQIQQNILLAIKHYRNERLWFNETSATAATTVSSAQVARRPTSCASTICTSLSRQEHRTDAAGSESVIEYRPTTNGRPRAYCYYRNQFELDRQRTSGVHAEPVLPEGTDGAFGGTDTNGWTTDAEDLIVFHAEKKLYANVIKDQAKAAVAAAQETRLR
jgi:hypothetical protein